MLHRGASSRLGHVSAAGNFTSCPCDISDDGKPIPEAFPDPEDEEAVAAWFAFSAARNRRCYEWDYWKVPGENGTGFNFLDHVSTWHLAQDLEQLRLAVGAPTLGVYGTSYGTAVMASYAAAFPDTSGRMIANGAVYNGGTVDGYAEASGASYLQGLEKLLDSCEAGGVNSGRDVEIYRNIDDTCSGLDAAGVNAAQLFPMRAHTTSKSTR